MGERLGEVEVLEIHAGHAQARALAHASYLGQGELRLGEALEFRVQLGQCGAHACDVVGVRTEALQADR